MIVSEKSIADLDLVVESLSPEEQSLFHRLFRLNITVGLLKAPEEMQEWIEKQFGSIEVTERQRIVRVTNMVTYEAALFNELRARRPIEAKAGDPISAFNKNGNDAADPLCQPLVGTPEDLIGRVRGRYCISASNIAKFDGHHSLLIFAEHNPLIFGREQVLDYLDTGHRWAEEVHSTDPEAKYYLFIWNCLWRAGASLLHGHAQVILGKGMHYAKIEQLRLSALGYRERHGANYFDDLYEVHKALGVGFEKEGCRVMASLTPIKEREVLVMAPAMDRSFQERLYEVLAAMRDKMGVASFNLVIYMPPIAPDEEDWSGFPVVARIVDRGDLAARTSDFASMEMYATSVVSSDPFRVVKPLKEALLGEMVGVS